MCHEFRRFHLKGVTQKDIAEDCGLSRESVSRFERGTLSNSVIFLWYIKHGLFDWVPIEKWQGWAGAFDE
jgi:transcriptional regulator with XRE-family HTH domain